MQVKDQMGRLNSAVGRMEMQVKDQMGRLNSAVGRVERRMVNFRTGSIVQSEEWRDACLG